MESCDANILLHAVTPNDALRDKAAAYLNSRDDDFVICELVLVELYGLLRNPVVSEKPLSSQAAVRLIQTFRSNPNWGVVDYPGNLMSQVWDLASQPSFPRTSIYDARLALTLRHHGVTHFATRNLKHFTGYGFDRVFDPTA